VHHWIRLTGGKYGGIRKVLAQEISIGTGISHPLVNKEVDARMPTSGFFIIVGESGTSDFASCLLGWFRNLRRFWGKQQFAFARAFHIPGLFHHALPKLARPAASFAGLFNVFLPGRRQFTLTFSCSAIFRP
jgi:hypothetical protein